MKTNNLNDQPKQKKQWQKPDFCILDNTPVNGGGSNSAFYEVHDGNHNKIKYKFNPTSPSVIGNYKVAYS